MVIVEGKLCQWWMGSFDMRDLVRAKGGCERNLDSCRLMNRALCVKVSLFQGLIRQIYEF